MIRAIYDYSGVHKGTLGFSAGDKFFVLKEETGDANWWQVVDNVGRVGFIPKNFVVKLKGNRCSIVTFTDRVLDHLSEQMKGVEPSHSEKRLIEKVKLARDQALAHLPHLRSGGCTPEDDKRLPVPACKVIDPETPQCCNDEDDHDHVEAVLVARKQSLVEMPESLGRELIEMIRLNTKLSYQLSKVAVVTALGHIKANVPSIEPELEAIIAMVNDAKDGANLSISHDAKRLREIFFELKGVKDDEEQRSWALYEDENAILELLEEFLSILANADTAISKHCIAQDNYEAVLCLVTYYQMEIRVTIRLLVLKVFGSMCALDPKVVSVLLSSVLPMELARDIQSSTEDIVRLSHTSLVLTMVFSSGESPPLPVYEYVNEDFIMFLLDQMDCPPPADVDDQVSDLFMGVILALNLHTKPHGESILLNALQQRCSAKVLTEKLLLLVNREEDPVRMFDHSPKWPNSALKLLRDILYRQDTAQLFYTNDIKVLLDIIVRNITDLSSEDERRNWYLRICQLVILNTNYHEHKHRQPDFQKCFQKILHGECPPNQHDIVIVQSIVQDFPYLFIA